MKRAILAIFFLVLSSTQSFAYPTSVKAELDLSITQASGGMAISDDDRYLFLAYGENMKVIDLATFALSGSQHPALSEDDDTDGNIGGIAFIPDGNLIYGSQADGDILKFDLDTITETPVSDDIVASKALTLMVTDGTAATPVIYIWNESDGYIYPYYSTSGEVGTIINIKGAFSTVTFAVKDMVLVPQTDEIYLATDAGRIFYTTTSGTIGSSIDFDTSVGDDIVGIAVNPDGSTVYAANQTKNEIEVISTSTHLAGTAIVIDSGDNSTFKDVVIQEMSDPSGDIYGFVSGLEGITVFDTYDDTVFDFDSTNDADTYDPISTTLTGPMIASGDGYIYLSSGGGEIAVITDRPYITAPTVAYTDSLGATATTLGAGGTVSLTFQSDTTGTYEVREGGDIDKSGDLLTDTGSATSGTITVDTDTTVSFAYDTNSGYLGEGSSTLFIFVTDAANSNLIGRRAATATVDTPPDGVTINSTGFGNGRVYVEFSRITDSDMDHYNVYVDTDATAVQTTTSVAATVTQPSGGSSVTGEVGGLTNGTTYYIAVEAIDSNSNVSTRVYQLSDGTPASAVPQETVGPAGLAGETGGCTMVPVAWRGGVILTPSLPALSEVEGSRGKDPVNGGRACFLFVLLPLFLFLILRARTSMARPSREAEGPELCRGAKFAGFLVLFILISSGAAAKERSPQFWYTEIKSGFWMPTDDTTKLFFDSCCNIQAGLNGGFLYKGQLGVGIGASFMSKDGLARGVGTGGISADRFNLFLIPMETDIAYRFDYIENQIVVPYLTGGGDYVFFRENVKGDTVKGLKFGLHAAGGIQFLIESLDTDASLEMDYGLNDVYVTLEARYNWINSFGKTGLDLSGMLYSVGLLFEF